MMTLSPHLLAEQPNLLLATWRVNPRSQEINNAVERWDISKECTGAQKS